MIGKDRQIELSLCNPGLSEHIINSPALLLPLLIDEALVGCRPELGDGQSDRRGRKWTGEGE